MDNFSAAILAIAVTFVLFLFHGAISRARARYAQILASRVEGRSVAVRQMEKHMKDAALRAEALRTRLVLEAYLNRGGTLATPEGKRILREHVVAHVQLIQLRGYLPERDAYLLSLALFEADATRPLPPAPY